MAYAYTDTLAGSTMHRHLSHTDSLSTSCTSSIHSYNKEIRYSLGTRSAQNWSLIGFYTF